MKIDGKEIANKILLELTERVKRLKVKGILSHLTVIIVGNSPSSVAYVNQKKIKGQIIGAKITVKYIAKDISRSQLLKTIEQLNNDNNVHGIIIQRPLPQNIDTNEISLAIDPYKDVDGLNPKSKFQPPIALAVLRILEEIYCKKSEARNPKSETDSGRAFATSDVASLARMTSLNIVIIGKGETGGKPIINTLKKMGVDTSIIDSKAQNPKNLTKKADIIISCVGKPNVVKPEMLKRGVSLIGVGLYKGTDGKMHGDYNEEKIKNIVSFYTPTPGGVGPVNVAMLLENLVTASEIKK